MYQPSHYDPSDTTVMYHIKFKPSGTGPWPTVLMIPPTVFRNGDANGTTKERVATRDLTDAGFLVFQIEHRLAPNGLLEGQHQHDTTPEGIASGHSFNYWHMINNITGEYVSSEVIDFLNAHKNDP